MKANKLPGGGTAFARLSSRPLSRRGRSLRLQYSPKEEATTLLPPLATLPGLTAANPSHWQATRPEVGQYKYTATLRER